MARGRRGGRGRGGDSEEIPVAEPVGAHESGALSRSRERPARAPSGPGFALPMASAAGLLAAILTFAAVLAVGRLAGGGGIESFDAAGVQAARMLATVHVERWAQDFGTLKAVRARVQNYLDNQVATAKKRDSRDGELVAQAIAEWKDGNVEVEAPWRPKYDDLIPPSHPEDTLYNNARTEVLKKITEGSQGALIGAAIYDDGGNVLAAVGTPYQIPATRAKEVGPTQVFAGTADGGRPMRIYRHPMRNARLLPSGNAVVFLDATGASGADDFTAAGAGAGAAFLGAFLVVLLMGMGPVKAVQRLAVEADALARGEFGTRVTTRGPDSVVAAAKAVQKLGALAAQGGGGGEPQIVTQQVVVQPTAEIQQGLAASRNFQRPQSLEIQSTSKQCPDAGNDYHDMVNIDDAHVGFLMADIPLHGVQGALYMAQVRALFRAECRKSSSPAEVLKAVNRTFAADVPRGVYVTALYCVLNTETGVCKVASAQHMPLVFWKLSKKASARLQPEGIALGLDAGGVFDKTLDEKAIQLEKGDRIVLFTDGAITARDPAGAIYGEEKFYYVINREAPKNSAAFVNFVANDVDLFHKGAQQLDDFTILTVRRVK